MTTVHPLALARAKLQWSQDKLAVEAGVSSDTISNIELRKRVPFLCTRRKLLEALGVPWGRQREVFGAGEA